MTGAMLWCRARLRGIGGDPRWLEATSGLAAALWGTAVLRLPADPGARGGYVARGLVLPPTVWGALFVAGGLLQLAAVLTDHTEARAPLAAAVGSGWLLVAYDLAAALLGSPTSWVLGALGTADGAAMLLLISLAFRSVR